MSSRTATGGTVNQIWFIIQGTILLVGVPTCTDMVMILAPGELSHVTIYLGLNCLHLYSIHLYFICSYICETPRLGYTQPPTTTTTQPPVLQCPSTFAQLYNGHCYEWFGATESSSGVGWTFDEGRQFCQSRFSGDLVSFGDKDEEDFFFNTESWSVPIPQAYWIGLHEDEGAVIIRYLINVKYYYCY